MSGDTALGQGNTNADAASGDSQDGGQDNQDNLNQDQDNQDNLNPGDQNSDESGDDSQDMETGDDDSGNEDSDQGAPDEYADFELAENTVIDEKSLEGFKELAKEAGLTQEQAQKFVDMQQAQQTAQVKQLTNTGKEWLKDAKSHFGEHKFDEAVSIASSGLEHMFGDDATEVKQILDNTQLGNNVTFIKAFHKIGEMVKEGTFIPGSQGQHTKKTAAQKIYNKE